MINVLGLALYGNGAASTRHRLTQYAPYLIKYDINLEVFSLLDDSYIKNKNNGLKINMLNVFKSYLKRFRIILEQDKYQCAIIHCELLPLVPSLIESNLIRIPYIYDFDDAFYLKYTYKRFWSISFFLKNKFEPLIRKSKRVNAGNKDLATYAKKINTDTFIIPTVIDTKRYINMPRKLDDTFTIGWIGSLSTSKYLNLIAPLVSDMSKHKKIRMRLIGAGHFDIDGVDIDIVPWDEDTEVELLHSFDVGIMPLYDSPWERGKCGFKLIQYMACGVPVIASPVGVNNDIVVHGKNGFLASNLKDWNESLLTLMYNPKLGEKMGKEGRRIVEDKYSVISVLPDVVESIRQTSGKI